MLINRKMINKFISYFSHYKVFKIVKKSKGTTWDYFGKIPDAININIRALFVHRSSCTNT